MSGPTISHFMPQALRHDSASPSIFFSLYPFADIWRAVLKLHAIHFAKREKLHYVAIDQAYVFQIYNDVAAVRLKLKKSPQLSYRRYFDSAT